VNTLVPSLVGAWYGLHRDDKQERTSKVLLFDGSRSKAEADHARVDTSPWSGAVTRRLISGVIAWRRIHSAERASKALA
jgi:hypothetical protein